MKKFSLEGAINFLDKEYEIIGEVYYFKNYKLGEGSFGNVY